MTVRRCVIAVLAMLVVFLQVRLWIGQGSLAHASALSERVELSVATNESKVQRNKVLKAEIVDLKSGLDAIEERARSEFGLIKEGETFFLLVDKEKQERKKDSQSR